MKIFTLIILVLFVVFSFLNGTLWADDTVIRIISPQEAQVFVPGDTVKIEVDVPSQIKATDGSIETTGLGSIRALEFTGTHFKAVFVIPRNFAGPVQLTPVVMASEMIKGDPVTIHVRPKNAPLGLKFSNRNYFLNPGEESSQIYVYGQYPRGVERDLTSSVTGTVYTSSNQKVITVDYEGLFKVVGNGRAVVTVENTGVRDHIMVVVEDPRQPDSALDISDQVTFECGESVTEEYGRRFRQSVTITNKTDLPITGPLYLAVQDVPDGARVYGDVVVLSLTDGLNLFPGQSVKADVVFSLWRDAKTQCHFKLYDHDPTDIINQAENQRQWKDKIKRLLKTTRFL